MRGPWKCLETQNLRLLSMPDLEIEPRKEYRSITRGMLVQDVDFGDPEAAEWKDAAVETASGNDRAAFRLESLSACKSNSIVLARGTVTLSIGGGQPNRVDCVRMAINAPAREFRAW